MYLSTFNLVETKILIFISPDRRNLNRGSCHTPIFDLRFLLHLHYFTYTSRSQNMVGFERFAVKLWLCRDYRVLWAFYEWLTTNQARSACFAVLFSCAENRSERRALDVVRRSGFRVSEQKCCRSLISKRLVHQRISENCAFISTLCPANGLRFSPNIF